MRSKIGFYSMMVLLAFACGVILIGCGDNNGPTVITGPGVTITVTPGGTGTPAPGVTVTTTPAPPTPPVPTQHTLLLTQTANGSDLNFLQLVNGNFSPVTLPYILPQPTALPTAPQIALTANANGVFGYTVNGSDPIVSASVNLAKGALIPNGTKALLASGNFGRACAVDPSGKFLYVATSANHPPPPPPPPIVSGPETIVVAGADWECFPINQTDGTLGTGTQPTPAPTAEVNGMAIATIGTAEVLVAALNEFDCDTFGQNLISEVINTSNGSFSQGSGKALGAACGTPRGLAVAKVGTNTYAYVPMSSGAVEVVPVNADGTFGTDTVQSVWTSRQAVACAVGTVGTTQCLYVISDATSNEEPAIHNGAQPTAAPTLPPLGSFGQMAAFTLDSTTGLLGNGSEIPAEIGGAHTFSNTTSSPSTTLNPCQSVAVDPNGQFVLFSTINSGGSGKNLFLFNLAQSGTSIGAPSLTPDQSANDGDPSTSFPSAPASLTLFTATF